MKIMKKKIYALLAFVMVAMTASAEDVPSYTIAKKQQADITIKVNGEVATTAKQNDVVTVVVTPPEGK
jgi:aspartate 1-decarboxylase